MNDSNKIFDYHNALRYYMFPFIDEALYELVFI